MKKSVVVVEDDRGLREQLVQILETAPDIKCLGAYVSAEEALPQILAKNPDVVLMDIKLPGMSGIQCVVEIKKDHADQADHHGHGLRRQRTHLPRVEIGGQWLSR